MGTQPAVPVPAERDSKRALKYGLAAKGNLFYYYYFIC